MAKKYSNFILESEDRNGTVYNNYREAFSQYHRRKESSTLYGVVDETGEIVTILAK